MANLTLTPSLDAVPQLETSTLALGGPGGIMNAQAQALLNRFAALQNYTTPSFGLSLIGYDSLLASGNTKFAGPALVAMGRVLQTADNTGVVVVTALLKALFDKCVQAGEKVILPAGHYLVDGPITSSSYLDGAALHIECIGDVTITVDPAAAVFTTLISCYTSGINSSTIKGGRLTLNLNNRCANGVYLRHAGGDGGTVHWGPVTVKNAKNAVLDGSMVPLLEENQGLLVYGRYTNVRIEHPVVDGVDRLRNPDGGCKGISISEIVGPVTIVSPFVARVLAGPGATQDADGISVFGYDSAGNPALYARREGQLTITDPVIVDCQGRSIKTQVSQSLIVNPRIYRKGVVAFATADIDHQVGGVHTITDPFFDWRKNGSTASVPAGFYAISFQARCSDSENRCTVRGGTLQSSIQVIRAVFMTVGATALESSISVEGMEARAVDGLAVKMYSSGFVEFNAGQVEAAVGNTHFALSGNRIAQSAGNLLAFSGGGLANSTKLSVALIGNINTGTEAAGAATFARLGGTVMTSCRSLLLRDNTGFTDYMGTWVFDTQALPVGTRFAYDRASSTVTNGPTIAAGSYCTVECLGSIINGARTVKISVASGATMTEHYTQFGGANWGTI